MSSPNDDCSSSPSAPSLRPTPHWTRMPSFPGDEPLGEDSDEEALDLAQASTTRHAIERLAMSSDLLLVPSSWSDEAEQPSPRRAAEDDTNSTAALVGTLRELAASASSRPRAELTWRRTHTFPEVKAAVPAGQLRRNLSEQQLRRCSEPPIGATEEYIMGDEEFQGAAFESYLEKADVTEGASLARSGVERRSSTLDSMPEEPHLPDPEMPVPEEVSPGLRLQQDSAPPSPPSRPHAPVAAPVAAPQGPADRATSSDAMAERNPFSASDEHPLIMWGKVWKKRPGHRDSVGETVGVGGAEAAPADASNQTLPTAPESSGVVVE
ncbi:unnamed protein product [Durusdinium trenchii]|uniref:Uncharacterized protein n=1 Tax=Durusdinium trenchii TaxID=1381693 RepID=A0ABP0JX66_9DINO